MELTLQREPSYQHATLGRLSLAGSWSCQTCEDEVRPEGVKVDGQTAIPPGRYELTIDYSQRFRKYMFHILNVPMFAGVRIHAGNTAADTEGCVLVGLTRGVASVGFSRAALVELWSRLAVSDGFDAVHGVDKFKMKEPTWITIRNHSEVVCAG